MTIRERLQDGERENLASWASHSAESRGRERSENPCPFRTDFQRDRDRVIHCPTFRRLAHKTQVFILPNQDHIRTRLTHTLEVAQIARTLARALRLNEDLTEAIALAHDLGHTPFGHAGEWALDEAVGGRLPGARFHHAEQSLRVVETLERDGRGLNLTWEVRQGIIGHTKGQKDLQSVNGGRLTLEGQCVRLADRIAYVNHDMEDAFRARIITEEDVPPDILDVLGRSHSIRIGRAVEDIVMNSLDIPELRIGDQILRALNNLKDFLFERVYSPTTVGEQSKVRHVVSGLFDYYCDEGWTKDDSQESSEGKEVTCRRACDYVAGMTDRFAIQRYTDLFIPDSPQWVEEV